MNDLLKSLLSQKGTNSYRTIVLVVCLYVAWKVTELERRVAVLETRLSVSRLAHSDPAASPDAGGVTIGPEWPKHLADPFRSRNP